ncbi:uncharacterized protein LOC124434952 [Xenia sp. Carnegie-2017]|uniref:uncharacterized protein LOC124434952 n=1 Tax=Xenia sp. Carnegie-2017 TaxID=2897299 RepID=UPI001F036E81|nr:uncharacterized protein LOC124434952 [Xenia sp. Carnegie-2017]
MKTNSHRSSTMFTFLFSISIILLAGTKVVQGKALSRSCLDYLKRGHKTDGFYKIRNSNTNKIITVYCDLTSEPGSAWTLVMSFALMYKNINQLTKKTFRENAPVNKYSPNWMSYRMSWSQMNYLKSLSTHWRTTCSYPVSKVDYRDYVRAKFSDFDIMTFLGNGVCKKVEFINIRGFSCADCTSKWWQILNQDSLHIDSVETGCQLVARAGAVSSEDNFGLYLSTNKKFRCTNNDISTTNWWFGGYI